MPSLHEIQRAFKQALSEDKRPWKADELDIRHQLPVSVEKRFGIYHYAYASRIADSLKEDFEPLLQWIDENSFEDLVRAYLRVYPSTYRTVAEVSRHFPDFLENILQPGDPKFLPDLARYEWAQICASVTATATPPDVRPLTELAGQTIGAVELVLSPSLELFTSEWPVDKLGRRLDGVVFRELTRIAIYRGPDGLYTDRLRSRQWELVARMELGEPLEALLTWMSEKRITPSQTQSWFARWAERGLIQGFRTR